MMTAQDMRNKLRERCFFLDGKVSSDPWADSLLILHLPRGKWTGETILMPRATPAQLRLFLLQKEDDGSLPALIAPYLSEEALRNLDRDTESLIALDFSGNGLVKQPDCYLFRTGQPNQYSERGRTKRSYGGASAQIAMTLLEQREWQSQTEVMERLILRGGRLTRGQISKLISVYAEDDALRREGRQKIIVHNPAVLLEKLSQEWNLPVQNKAFFSFPEGEGWESLARKAGEHHLTWCLAPSSSLIHYATLGEGGARSLWTDDPDTLIRICGLLPAAAPPFAEVELTRQAAPRGYFQTFADRTGLIWSGPVTSWLAASRGDARQQDTAKILYHELLHFRFAQLIQQ